MNQNIREIILASIIFIGVDSIWLSLIMKNHFAELIMKIQNSEMELNLLAALFCYIYLVGGLYHFVITKTKKFDVIQILILSVPYGLATYGTYDFTTAAVLKDWDLLTAFMDVAWGAILCSITSVGVLYYKFRYTSIDRTDPNYEVIKE